MNEILITFKEDLSTMVFTQNGNIVDSRTILIGLAKGVLEITYEEVWSEPSGMQTPRLMSQTWKVIPSK